MEIKKDPPAMDAHAFSFLGMARQYQKAANLLYDSDKTLTHAIELALKAFLRAFDFRLLGMEGGNITR